MASTSPRTRDFRALWAATALSDAGSAITFVALPLAAIHHAGAGAAQMGILVALERAPVLLFGLAAGVWIDRLRRRPLLIGADLARAVLLAAIPLAALAGVLRLELLYAVAFGLGTFGLAYDLVSTSYLPALVGREALLPANARLQMTHQVTAALGTGLGGVLVARLTAPIAIACDALTYLASAVALTRIHHREAAPAPSVAGAFWSDVREGMRASFRHPLVAAMIVTSTFGSFAGAMATTLLVLFLARELGVGPVGIGVVAAMNAAGGFVGARFAPSAAARLGAGRALVAGCFASVAGAALLPAAGRFGLPGFATAAAAQFVSGFALALYSVNQISLRQAVIPDALLGRVNATRRVLVFGVIPLGALAAGALGEVFGLRVALIAGVGAMAVSALYALSSPLRQAPGAAGVGWPGARRRRGGARAPRL